MRAKPVTLKALAKAAGVSIATASNAFNRPDQLSDELRRLVLRRAEAMGYRGPAIEGRLLRTGHAGAIALYAREPLGYLLEDRCAIAFLQAISGVCQARQLGLVMLPSVPREGGTHARLPAALDVAAVDGFLMYCLPDDDPAIARILERGRPLVAVDMSPDTRFAGVNIDDEGGARLAARHVIARGCRRPAVLSLPIDAERESGALSAARLANAPFPVTRTRWCGYAAQVREAGIGRARLPVEVAAINAEPDGYRAAWRLLSRRHRPDALLAMTDVLAQGALAACREKGLSVPDDVAIVGYDDIGPGATEAALTTVRQPVDDKGRLAVERLIADSETAIDRLPVELVVRGSA